MTISGQNFEVFQGDNEQVIITVRDENNQILNLTGYSAVWCAHTFPPNEQIVIEKTTEPLGGITIPDVSNGELIIELEQIDTQNLTAKTYGHQCEISDASGNHSMVTTGYMKVLKSHTHSSL